MMAFGRDQFSSKRSRRCPDLCAQSFRPAGAKAVPAAKLAAGKEVFVANCVACHGEDAKGKHDSGAPDLTDGWIYGGDAESIHTTVYAGHQGHMPSWETGSRRSNAKS